jgi:hypothetical protein
MVVANFGCKMTEFLITAAAKEAEEAYNRI